jgi:type II secretory pathway pseudopilin PulG
MHRGAIAWKTVAFSLLELLIAIVVILATLLIPLFSAMRARAQRVQCMANLRSLHIAANLYLQQNGSWPQITLASEDDAAEASYATAWIAALKPFGPTERTWICPTIQNLMQNPDYMKPENVRVDYMATPFDDKAISPHQWPRQPWFIETADVHGSGNLIIFTDGSASDLNSVAPNRQ